MNIEIRVISQSDFWKDTDYTNPKAVSLIYSGETNSYFTHGKMYSTYAPNIYWLPNKGSYENPVGRLIYAIGKTNEMVKIYFDVDAEPFQLLCRFRANKIAKLDV